MGIDKFGVFERIEPGEDVMEIDRPVWKKGCPPSRILYASNGEQNIVIDAMGPVTDDYFCDDLNEWMNPAPNDKPGIWVVEVTIVPYTMWTDYGEEHDIDFDFSEARPATAEEIAAHNRNEYLWDRYIWEEKQEADG